MYFTTLFTTIVLAAAGVSASPITDTSTNPKQVGRMNFWKQGGCTPSATSCAPLFPVFEGCQTAPVGCNLSGMVTQLNSNCKITIWTDKKCSSVYNIIDISPKQGVNNCKQPGPLIGSISAVCK